MKRLKLTNIPRGRALRIAIWTFALSLAACDNSVNFTPTTPSGFGAAGDRTLDISGSLTAKGGACLEATVLYDGLEVPGARVVCPDADGCAVLDLAATTPSPGGHHTVSFQVLRQSPREVEYEGEGRIFVTRENLGLTGVNLDLGPETATLRRGDSISFEISLTDF